MHNLKHFLPPGITFCPQSSPRKGPLCLPILWSGLCDSRSGQSRQSTVRVYTHVPTNWSIQQLNGMQPGLNLNTTEEGQQLVIPQVYGLVAGVHQQKMGNLYRVGGSTIGKQPNFKRTSNWKINSWFLYPTSCIEAERERANLRPFQSPAGNRKSCTEQWIWLAN